MEISKKFNINDLDKKILQLLKKNPNGLTKQEISEKIENIPLSTIYKYMKKFLFQEVIKTRKEKMNEYGRYKIFFYLDQNHIHLKMWEL